MRNRTKRAWQCYGVICALPLLSVTSHAASADGAIVELEEVVITGSRLKSRDLEAASPTTVFDRERIENLGVASVSEVLKHVPQQPYGHADFYRADGAQFAEIRGLGVDTTLILINGRRAMPSAANVSANALDLNTIPLAAVERVEVLSDAASAVYGADAVGGVINIVLNRGVEGAVVDLRYGAASGGADETRYSLTAGHRGERFRGTVVLDFLDKGELLGGERDRWRDQDYRRFGSVDQRSPLSNPGNITAVGTAPLPGLSSRFAAVPVGSSGVGLSVSDFAATDGTRNMESLQRYDTIVPAVERASVAGFVEFELVPDQVLFGELLYSDRDQRTTRPPPTLSGVQVPASNPFNPFGVPVRADFMVEGVGARSSRVESELSRGVVGARGLLGAWDWETSFVATHETASTWTEKNLDAGRVAAALAATDPAQALNVFQDGPGGSPALLASLIADPVHDDFASDGRIATAFVRGPLWQLPGGELEAVVGAEWRREGILYDSFLLVDEDRTSRSGFAELSIPIVGKHMQVPGVHSLGLRVAARQDHYDSFGRTTNPQIGITWKPLSSVLLRASYGTSFRPPSLFELYAPRTAVPLQLADPRRNGEVTDLTGISGGNPDLVPIEGESWTGGVVWTPSTRGLQLAASWWRVVLDRRVQIVPYQAILEYESLFSDRVIRAAPTDADLAAGLPGRLVQMDISRTNYGRLETSGVDATASYAFDLAGAELRTEITSTWVHDYRSVDLPDSPPIERVGIANVFGTIARWRGTASVAYAKGPWNASLIGRFTASYDDSIGVPSIPTGRRINPPTYVDLQVSWSANLAGLEETLLKGTRVAVGASNIFDEEPPFSERGGIRGVDISQADLRQRFVYINVSKRF